MLLNAREPERGPVRCERRRLPASIVYTDPIGPKPLSTEWHKIAIRVALDVCARRRISVNEVMGKRRHRYLVLARQEIMWLLHNGSHRFKSLPQIGRWMGGLDHTTVLHGIRSHQRRIDSGEIEP